MKKFKIELYFSKIKQTNLDERPKLENYTQRTIITEEIGDNISSVKKKLKQKFKNLSYIYVHDSSYLDENYHLT